MLRAQPSLAQTTPTLLWSPYGVLPPCKQSLWIIRTLSRRSLLKPCSAPWRPPRRFVAPPAQTRRLVPQSWTLQEVSLALGRPNLQGARTLRLWRSRRREQILKAAPQWLLLNLAITQDAPVLAPTRSWTPGLLPSTTSIPIPTPWPAVGPPGLPTVAYRSSSFPVMLQPSAHALPPPACSDLT